MNALRSKRRSHALLVPLCSLIGLWAISVSARAESAAPDGLTTRFTIDDADPESSVPTEEAAMRSPLEMGYHIMLLSEKAESASARGDHAAAARYWRALAKAVPDQSMPYTKLCRSYEAAGDSAKALEACRSALGRRGVTLEDNRRYVELLLQKPRTLDPSEVEDIDAIAAHLERELGAEQGPLAAERMRCQLGVKLSDATRLTACTAKLNALAPKDPQTLVYAWTLAMQQGDLSRAEALVQRARTAELPAPALERMVQALAHETELRTPAWRRALRTQPWPLGAAALAVSFGLGFLLVRRRQRHGHHVRGR